MSQLTIDPVELERRLARLSPEERDLVERMLKEQAEGHDETFQKVKEAVFERPIPPMDEFIFSKEYLSLPKTSLYPAVLDLLYQIDQPDIREVFVCAGKGSGKSTLTSITMARATHTLSFCYRDPAAHFKLLPGENIAIVNMSIGADQAEQVMFSKYLNLIRGAPCFKSDKGEDLFRKLKRHLIFPKGIHAMSGHSGYKAYFGYNVFCGVLDEIAWYKDKQDRVISDEVYQGVKSAAKTRFDGHYKVLAISSPQAQDDFIWKKIEEGRNRGKRVVVGEVDGDSYAKVL